MNKIRKLLIGAYIIIFMILISVKVMVVNYDSTYGYEYDGITGKINKLHQENARLSQKVASASSLLSISQKAKLLGLETGNEIVSLYAPQPLAKAGIQ